MKTLRTLAALAFVALSIAACKTENPEEPIVPEEPTTRTLQVEVTPEVTTRASIDDNTTFAWDDADSRLFSVLVDGKFVEADSFAIEGNKATFNVEIPTTALSLQAFYRPALLSPHEATISLSASTTLREAGRLEGFTLLTEEPATFGEQTESISLTMTMPAAVARFGVYSSAEEYAGESIRSISIEASQPINGTLKYKMSGSTTLEGGTNTSVVALANGYTIGSDKDSAEGIYLSLAPAKSNGIKYVILTDVAKYTFISENEITFEKGTIHNLYFDLKNANTRLENNAQVVTYDTTYLTTAIQVSAMGGQQDMGYYLASVDGVQDTTNYTADYYASISFRCYDADGADVDWISCSIANYNHPILNIARNEAIDGRTCSVDIIYTPSTKDYAIENPVIATIAVAQNGASAVSTLHYQWFGESEIIIPGGGLNGVKGLGYFLAYLDGSATAVPDAEAIEPFFKTVEVSSDADWCRVSVVGGNFNNLQLESIEPNPSTAEERVATITAVFNGDRDAYTMTPDYTAFTLKVVQQPAKAAGQTSELYYTTANLSTSPVIATAGVVDRDLGYFFAVVDGMQTDDATTKYFSSLEVSVDASWLTARVAGNHVYVTVEASTEGWRKAKVTINYPASDKEVTLLGGNPAVEIEVTQLPAQSEGNVAVYTFGNDPNNLVLRRDVTIGSTGGENIGITWMSVYKIVDGIVDTTRDNTFGDDAHAMTYSYVDAEGNNIDWLSAGVGGDWLNYSAAANNSGQQRVGYIHVHPATGAGQAYEGYDILDPCLVVKVVQSAQ